MGTVDTCETPPNNHYEGCRWAKLGQVGPILTMGQVGPWSAEP